MPVLHRGKQPHWPAPGGARLSGAANPSADRAATLRWLDERDGDRVAAWSRRIGRALWRRFNRLNAPVVYPWSPSRRGAAPVHELHRVAAELTRRHTHGGPAILWRWTKAVMWPLVASAAIVPLALKCGRQVRAGYGLSRRAQVRELCTAAWRHGIFPTEYYHHRLYARPAGSDLAEYLNEREIIALLWWCDRGTDFTRVDHVRRFFSECRAAGLPVPRMVAAFRGGGIEFCCDATTGALPEKDLFLRPESWDRGVVGQQWRWNARARMWTHRGEAFGATALLQHARKLAVDQPWLLQEAAGDHPEIARFAASGVCTVHIATGLDAAGVPQPLFASMRLPASVETGWGPCPGDLTAGIDPPSGRLGRALGDFVNDGEFAVHPGTGAMIEGAMVPEWSALLALARRAHECFADVPFLGWRIALTGSGPMLVDASTMWGVVRHVWPAQTPFLELCGQRLAALLAAEASKQPAAAFAHSFSRWRAVDSSATGASRAAGAPSA